MLRRLFSWSLLFLLLVLPIRVSAQAMLRIDLLEVDIWPEYDRPDVLVIYRITLPESTDLPIEISLRIPSAAGSPYNVAMKDLDGMLYNLSYTSIPDGDWIRIVFTALSTELQVEYYDPRMMISGDTRTFEYIWPGDYAVNSLVVRVQQPLHATLFKVDPDMGNGGLEEDNLTYFTQVVGRLEAGSQWKIHLSYDNPSDGLSANLQPVQPVQPIPTQPEGTTIAQRWMIWGSGIIIALFILAGAFLFWRNRKKTGKSLINRPVQKETAAPTGEQGEGRVYCHQCGKLSVSGDVYCRICGTKLRSE